MNTIGWGQAINNNSIRWGLSNQNKFKFGIIYGESYQGETAIG